MTTTSASVLVHVASGIGNIVLATPLFAVLRRNGFAVDVLVDADYPGVGELLQGHPSLRSIYGGRAERVDENSYDRFIAAIPPFYWHRYARRYAHRRRSLFRAPDELFYRDEQAYYLEFARPLGCDVTDPPYYSLPTSASTQAYAGPKTLVLAPGCKTGEMAAKRWPFFAELAAAFADVVLIGTTDDLSHFDRSPMHFPAHTRSFVGRLSLKQNAAVIAHAGAVVANDSGLGHIAGALGVPTILLFGPTSDSALGRLPPNVTILRRGLPCEPCWFNGRFEACAAKIRCLHELGVEVVAAIVAQALSSQRDLTNAAEIA